MLFKIKNLEYKIENQKILSNQSFDLKESNHLLILGPSGCGKTTLINLMSGLLIPTSGQIIYENKNYSLLSNEKIDRIRAENFGFIFQKLHLIGHLSLEDNIRLVQNNNNFQNVNNLINKLGLSKKRNEKAKNLSFGEAQRVAIARGVANNPRVIFADEPTSALDDLNAKNVMDIIFSQAEKTKSTLIVCTHDERIKKLFSNVLEM